MVSFSIAVISLCENGVGLNSLLDTFSAARGEINFVVASCVKLLVMDVSVFGFLTIGILDAYLLEDSGVPSVVATRPLIFANELAVGAWSRDEDGTRSFSDALAVGLLIVGLLINGPRVPIDGALPSVTRALRPKLLTSEKDTAFSLAVVASAVWV